LAKTTCKISEKESLSFTPPKPVRFGFILGNLQLFTVGMKSEHDSMEA